MRFRASILTALLLVAVLLPGAAAAGEKVYGKGVAKADTVRIASILAAPGDYLGKTVRIEGTVVGCCKMRGCWIDLASDKPYEKIQIKVNDGEIVFPMEIMGERVRAEGVVEAVPLTREEAVSYLEKEASCQKETFDAATVPAEGITIYRIHGVGAVVVPAEAPAAASGGVDEASVAPAAGKPCTAANAAEHKGCPHAAKAAEAATAEAAAAPAAPVKPCPHEAKAGGGK